MQGGREQQPGEQVPGGGVEDRVGSRAPGSCAEAVNRSAIIWPQMSTETASHELYTVRPPATVRAIGRPGESTPRRDAVGALTGQGD